MTPQGEYRRPIVTEVAKWPINGLEGKEARILTVEYPQAYVPPHTAIRAGCSSEY